jgi:AraC family transcriptional regulator
MAVHAIRAAFGTQIRNAIAAAPVLSSAESPWREHALEQYRLESCELPAHSNLSHWIVLQQSDSPVAIDYWVDCGSTRRVTRRDGDIGVRTAGEYAGLRWNGSGSLTVLAVQPAAVQRFAEEHGRIRQVELVDSPARDDQTLRHLILAMRSELKDGCPGGRLFGDSLLTAIIAHVLKHYSADPGDNECRSGVLSSERLRVILEYIDANLDRNMSLHELARVVQASTCHFARLFKSTTGLTPHQFVLRRRLDKARALLRDRGLTIAEVAYVSGFATQAHLTTVFRKLTGSTPNAYRASFMGRSVNTGVAD